MWKRLNISFLLRLELADEGLLPLMPMMGFNYQLLKNEQLFINASISQNYNLPSLNDLYWYPGGNENLKAESGVEVEGGLNYSKNLKNNFSLSAGLTAYYSWINDWIQWTPSDYRYWTPENISDVYARGLEAFVEFFRKNWKTQLQIAVRLFLHAYHGMKAQLLKRKVFRVLS